MDFSHDYEYSFWLFNHTYNHVWRSVIMIAIFSVTFARIEPLAWSYVDPTTGKNHVTEVWRSFDPPGVRWMAGHRGVDLAAAPGATILAAGEGKIAFAGVVAGVPTVSIDHDDGIRTTYHPVIPWVKPGEYVAEGQPIGVLSHPRGKYPGLQWGARYQNNKDAYVDPLSLLDAPLIRLKEPKLVFVAPPKHR